MKNGIQFIAFYLPQFHEIPENNRWWGKGFTEWTNTTKARPLFKNHYQPHEPIDDYYYDLSEADVFPWQINLAMTHGVDRFCFYHYWFKGGKKLLEKPVENYLNNKELNFPFCLSWANEPWSRRRDGLQHEVLMHQDYGHEDEWQRHFQYLLPFFMDSRYIRHNGMPLITIYKSDQIPFAREMISCWRKLAAEAGLPGLAFAWQYPSYLSDDSGLSEEFDLLIKFEPLYSLARLRLTEGISGLLVDSLKDTLYGNPLACFLFKHYLGRLAGYLLPKACLGC